MRETFSLCDEFLHYERQIGLAAEIDFDCTATGGKVTKLMVHTL